MKHALGPALRLGASVEWESGWIGVMNAAVTGLILVALFYAVSVLITSIVLPLYRRDLIAAAVDATNAKPWAYSRAMIIACKHEENCSEASSSASRRTPSASKG